MIIYRKGDLMKEYPIKISICNGAIQYELTLEKWAVNCNTKQFLYEEIKRFLDDVILKVEIKEDETKKCILCGNPIADFDDNGIYEGEYCEECFNEAQNGRL